MEVREAEGAWNADKYKGNGLASFSLMTPFPCSVITGLSWEQMLLWSARISQATSEHVYRTMAEKVVSTTVTE